MSASEYQLHVSFSRRHQAGQQRASLLLIVQEDGVLVLCSPWGGSLTGKNFLPVPPKYLSFCHKPEKIRCSRHSILISPFQERVVFRLLVTF